MFRCDLSIQHWNLNNHEKVRTTGQELMHCFLGVFENADVYQWYRVGVTD